MRELENQRLEKKKKDYKLTEIERKGKLRAKRRRKGGHGRGEKQTGERRVRLHQWIYDLDFFSNYIQ